MEIVLEVFFVKFVYADHLINIFIFHFIFGDWHWTLTIEVSEIWEKDNPMVCHDRTLTDYIGEVIFTDVKLSIIGYKDHRRPETSYLLENNLFEKEMNILRRLHSWVERLLAAYITISPSSFDTFIVLIAFVKFD